MSRTSRPAHDDPDSESALRTVVAQRLREFRTNLDWSLNQLAGRSDVSKAMLSKIENGQAAPTLATLARIAAAMSIPVTAFFRGLDEEHDLLHVKAGGGLEITHRASAAGQRYELLGRMRHPHDRLEPTLVTIDSAEEMFPLYQHGGTELLFIVQGALEYGYGSRIVTLGAGDTLQFLGEVPHGPTSILEAPVVMLSVKAIVPGSTP